MKQFQGRRPCAGGARVRPVLSWPVLAAWGATCGPDAYGYTWRDNDGATFEDIPFVNPITLVPPAPGEPPVRVPLSFSFYGTLYREVYISPEGWVSFADPGDVSLHTPCAPSADAPNAFIGALMPSFPVVADTLQYESFHAGVFKVYWDTRRSRPGPVPFRVTPV